MRLRLLLIVVALLAMGRCAMGATNHYLDCNAGSDVADSLTPQTAWRTVAKANSYVFQPGDSLLLRRGSRCEGMLWPKGSGTEKLPIHVGAYGQGALPILHGGAESAGFNLHNQQYWEIENLEVIGGSPYGVRIGGNNPVLRHFRVTNVVIHDVVGKPSTKDSGLLVITPDDKSRTIIDDVIVDGVTAYETSEWAGIIVSGAGFDSTAHEEGGGHVVIRNSIVHDVAGDGILLARVTDGVLEHNVAWYTGMQETQTIGTPNAIWEWRCSDCRVAYNEGFFTDSPGVDGGVFDIDYGDENNVVEHNFGHDSQGYCVSVFGAEGQAGNTTDSTIRNNTCIHNGRSPRLAKRQGAILLYTWDGGKLDGVTIEGNDIVWDPPLKTPAMQFAAEFTGKQANRVANNTIVAPSSSFVTSAAGVQFSGNRYCGPLDEVESNPVRAGLLSDSPQVTDAATGQKPETDSAATKPYDLCGCMKELLTKSRASDRSHEGGLVQSNHWQLLATLAPPGTPGAAPSRSGLVLIESMMHQFADLGLAATVVPASSIDKAELEQWRVDWHFDSRINMDVANAESLRNAYSLTEAPQLLLVSPTGHVVARWEFPIVPADVWLQIQSQLGTPRGTQQLPSCPNAPVAH